jgi:hypothetical protein
MSLRQLAVVRAAGQRINVVEHRQVVAAQAVPKTRALYRLFRRSDGDRATAWWPRQARTTRTSPPMIA